MLNHRPLNKSTTRGVKCYSYLPPISKAVRCLARMPLPLLHCPHADYIPLIKEMLDSYRQPVSAEVRKQVRCPACVSCMRASDHAWPASQQYARLRACTEPCLPHKKSGLPAHPQVSAILQAVTPLSIRRGDAQGPSTFVQDHERLADLLHNINLAQVCACVRVDACVCMYDVLVWTKAPLCRAWPATVSGPPGPPHPWPSLLLHPLSPHHRSCSAACPTWTWVWCWGTGLWPTAPSCRRAPSPLPPWATQPRPSTTTSPSPTSACT
jgi:hypothetical protein